VTYDKVFTIRKVIKVNTVD